LIRVKGRVKPERRAAPRRGGHIDDLEAESVIAVKEILATRRARAPGQPLPPQPIQISSSFPRKRESSFFPIDEPKRLD
jgi:hypothetical protein